MLKSFLGSHNYTVAYVTPAGYFTDLQIISQKSDLRPNPPHNKNNKNNNKKLPDCRF